jgi:hypothetical protein
MTHIAKYSLARSREGRRDRRHLPCFSLRISHLHTPALHDNDSEHSLPYRFTQEMLILVAHSPRESSVCSTR